MVGWGLEGQEEEEEDRVLVPRCWAHCAVSAPPPSLWSRPRRYQVRNERFAPPILCVGRASKSYAPCFAARTRPIAQASTSGPTCQCSPGEPSKSRRSVVGHPGWASGPCHTHAASSRAYSLTWSGCAARPCEGSPRPRLFVSLTCAYVYAERGLRKAWSDKLGRTGSGGLVAAAVTWLAQLSQWFPSF